ncbi:unnamed protein product [Amaranthus hypochondriacus]
MEKLHLFTFSFLLFIVLSLTLLTFVFCIFAEFKKSKGKDVKIDGKLCEIPESEAFLYGLTALICLSAAQMIGNSIFFYGNCPNSNSKERTSCFQLKMPTISYILLIISWIIFGACIILISTGTSMNKRQAYGKGWLEGECYLVKDGVFVGASILALVSFGCTLALSLITLRKRYQVVHDEKHSKSTS